MTRKMWEVRKKRIKETAKQVAAILAENNITYNEVPQVFGDAQNYLLVSTVSPDAVLENCPVDGT